MNTSPVLAEDWNPTPMVIEMQESVGEYDYKDYGSDIEIPFSLSGKGGKMWLIIETRISEDDKPVAVRNGFKGWHYVNRIDTTMYVSAPRIYDIGPDNLFPVGLYELDHSTVGINKAIQGSDDISSPTPDIYICYLWGYDHQSDRELACNFLPIGNYWEGQYLRFYVEDDQGMPYEAPLLMGQLPFFLADMVSANYDSLIGRADILKWKLGSDPYNTSLLETSDIFGYDPNETFTHPEYSEETPWHQYSLGYGAGIFDPTNHSAFYFAQNRHWENTQTVVKYDYVPNGKAARDIDWGGYENELTWSHDGQAGDYSLHPVILNYGDDKLILLDGSKNGENASRDRLRVISKDDPTDVFFDIPFQEFYMPAQPDDPITGETRTNSELNRLAPGKRDGTFYITGSYSCLTELINMSRLIEFEGECEPYASDGAGYVVWANSNGDFFFDMSAYPDPDNPEQLWACIVSDPKNTNNPRRYLATTDMYGFLVSYSEFTGTHSFGIYCPDGTGIGLAGFGDDANSYGGEVVFERGGGELLDYGGQYDGMYIPPSKFGGTYDDPDMLKTTWVACDSDRGILYIWPSSSLFEFGPHSDEYESGVEESPTAFSVAQNSPNPFNPSTTIAFTLPETGNVSVAVYNIGGQKVDTLLDESMTAGTHSVIWDASGYSAGVYFYTVTSDGYSKTMKMTLVK